MTDTSFHALHNFATAEDSFHPTLNDALRAIDGMGPTDEWLIREVTNGSVIQYVTYGCGHSIRQ
jgi:hypothetical protein